MTNDEIDKLVDEIKKVHAVRFLDWCITMKVDYTLPDFDGYTIYDQFLKTTTSEKKD
jgi:hypothetical protein